MIRGLGNDIIAINRIRKIVESYEKRFLDKILSEREQEYCLRHNPPDARIAGRFAAKEAIAKAFGTGFKGFGWRDIEILNDDSGKPYATFSDLLNNKFNFPKVHISISHCDEYATAVALWET